MNQEKSKVGLSSPWATCYRQFQAFFKNDPDVKVVFDENGPEIDLYVSSAEKAAALYELIEPVHIYGNVFLKVTVIPPNEADLIGRYENCFTPADIINAAIKAALKGNAAVESIQDVTFGFATTGCYVCFKKEVVQYFNDNIADLHGLTSTLYQDLAQEIFKPQIGIFFCTAPDGKLGMPLGEWP